MSRVWHKLRFARDHRWTPPHMSAYLDSELSAWAGARLERHTAVCPECRGVLHDLRRMLALLQSAPPQARPVFLQLAVVARDLKVMSRADSDPFAPRVPSRLRTLWTLWRASRSQPFRG